MKLERIQKQQRAIIYPGEFYASNRKVIISTLLGSCVAACLYDPVNHVAGMNHFLLSSEINKTMNSGFITASGRYGVQAMELLINKMFKLGADRRNLKAKAFGGATMKGFGIDQPNWKSIGENNIRFIQRFLTAENIPLMAEDMGGDCGRTIHFASSDFIVYVRKHKSVDLGNLFENEKQYQQDIRRKQEQSMPDFALWN